MMLMLTMRPKTRRRNPRTRKCFTMRHDDHPRASLDWVNMHMPIPIVRKNPCECVNTCYVWARRTTVLDLL
jgi:hypothetical protein